MRASPRHPAARLPALCCLLVMVGCAPAMNLKGKCVVVTGASSGFGKGVALKMAAEGANVVLAARRTQLLDEVARQCEAKGVQALVVTTDVGQEQDVAKLARAATARFGRIDVWINNAGVGAIGRFDELPLKDQVGVVNTNFNGVLYGSYFALRLFRQQRAGTLINVGSVDSTIPIAYMATYNATKHAVLGLDDSIYQELRLSGEKDIHICTVMPYAVDTPWWDHAANASGRKPRMAQMDDPSLVVDAIVDAARHPQEEVVVGFKAKLVNLSHRIAPGLTDDLTSDTFDHELKKAAPTGPSDGAVLQPMLTGTDVGGGVRDRMNAEDAQPKK